MSWHHHVVEDRCGTYTSGTDFHPLMVQVHTRNDDGHLTGTFEAQDVRLLQLNNSKCVNKSCFLHKRGPPETIFADRKIIYNIIVYRMAFGINFSQDFNDELISVRSRNCGCLVTWFCYQLIAKPGNKTATVPWPDPYNLCEMVPDLHKPQRPLLVADYSHLSVACDSWVLHRCRIW